MKKLILALALVGLTGSVLAQQVNVGRNELGSGTPGMTGFELAGKWDNNIFHAPQYMPGHPTAATLYPRVVDVECTKVATGLNCKGYNWLPELGRGEYLMIRPVLAPEPKVVEKMVPVPFAVPGPTVYKEVEVKKKKE
jgi:hypothetical protein